MRKATVILNMHFSYFFQFYSSWFYQKFDLIIATIEEHDLKIYF